MLQSGIEKVIYDLLEGRTITREDISLELDISKRSVQNFIKLLNDYLRVFSLKIESKPGSGNGYSLATHSETQINVSEIAKSIASNDSELRKRNIALDFLLADQPYKVDDLAEKYFVVSRQIRNDISEIKRVFSKYHVVLDFSNTRLLKIKGEETDIRKCIKKNIEYEIPKDMKEIYTEIKNLVFTIISQSEYRMNDLSFENFCLHLTVMVYRNLQGKELAETANLSSGFTSIIPLAVKIYHKITSRYSLDYNENELHFICVHLAIKQSLSINDQKYITQDICEIVYEMLEYVDGLYKTKLRMDFNLCMFLTLHFIPLMKRIETNIYYENPLIENIRKNYLYEYELAETCAQYINGKMGCILPEDELGFIALDIRLSLSNRYEKKNNILIVCSTGRGTSEIIKQNFIELFSRYIRELNVVSLSELRMINIDNYDYVFSTVPIDSFQINKPAIFISTFLTDRDIERVKSTFEHKKNYLRYFNKKLIF